MGAGRIKADHHVAERMPIPVHTTSHRGQSNRGSRERGGRGQCDRRHDDGQNQRPAQDRSCRVNVHIHENRFPCRLRLPEVGFRMARCERLIGSKHGPCRNRRKAAPVLFESSTHRFGKSRGMLQTPRILALDDGGHLNGSANAPLDRELSSNQARPWGSTHHASATPEGGRLPQGVGSLAQAP
jgi:hypothetical protein